MKQRFELIPVDQVLDYINKYVFNSKSEDRVKNAKKLLKKIADKKVIAYHGFIDTEMGERSLMLGVDTKEWWWAGDESDWEEVESDLEGEFINQTLEFYKLNFDK